jgi:hypothetical protein
MKNWVAMMVFFLENFYQRSASFAHHRSGASDPLHVSTNQMPAQARLLN